ncbi:MAG TPA: tRNA (adenosine(37)-N6)-threonylcarbamoyltransferase complex dimerization subunit type 1 TsaB [bacterium]|nr:tRNA (adenosine(37)-N6)-threonylcarbamoyltransferase complex dimerization subunit type 1 TsaB [bacterium]
MTREVMLAVTGSGAAVEFALAEATAVCWSEQIVTKHATEELDGLAARMLAAADAQQLRIATVGVECGPGSFSGMRVTLAFARAFAWARQLPVLGYDALTLLYHQQPVPRMVTVLDARRGELFAALWRDGSRDGDGIRYPAAELVALLQGDAWTAAGNGAVLLQAAGAPVTLAAELQPRAATIARLHYAGVPALPQPAARYVRGAL